MLAYILTGIIAYLSLKNHENIEYDDLTKKNKWLKIFYKNCAIFILTIVFALRNYDVGTDTKNYLEIFNRLGSDFSNNTYVYEKGFCFVSILTNKIFGNFTIFLVVFGLILHWNLITSFCELSKSPSISILCYFVLRSFAQSCNILRQYVALSFCLIALCYLLKKNSIINFITYVFIGFLFHKTALVFFIIIPIRYIRFNIKTMIIVILSFLLIIPLLSFMVEFIDLIFNGVNYSGYIRFSINLCKIENIGTLVLMIASLLLLIKIKSKYKNLTSDSKEYEFFANLFLLFVGIFILSMFTSEVVNRLALYFMPSIFFIISMVFKSLKSRINNLFIDLLAIILIIITAVFLKAVGSYGVMPYTFI